MKKFDWKLALQKRWMELVVAIVWLISGVNHLCRAIEVGGFTQWSCAICLLLCCPCWLYIFYKRAKRDGA